jgi:hypothetical protein
MPLNSIHPMSHSHARFSTLPLGTCEIFSCLVSWALPIDAFLVPCDMESCGGPITATPPKMSNRCLIGHRRHMPLPPLGLLAPCSLLETTDILYASNSICFISYTAVARTKWRNQCIASSNATATRVQRL